MTSTTVITGVSRAGALSDVLAGRRPAHRLPRRDRTGTHGGDMSAVSPQISEGNINSQTARKLKGRTHRVRGAIAGDDDGDSDRLDSALRKVGDSGWWVLMGFVPVANFVMFLVFARNTPNQQRYPAEPARLTATPSPRLDGPAATIASTELVGEGMSHNRARVGGKRYPGSPGMCAGVASGGDSTDVR